MAKGGFQRRRIQAKKLQERQARKRARRNRLIATWTAGLLLVGLIAVLVLALGGNEKADLASDGSPSPSPRASGGCTKSSDDTVGKKSFPSAPCLEIDPKKAYTATLRTSKGTFRIRLLADKAPQTVNNFVFLARNKFYDDSIFHRVIPDFGRPGSDMVQGGDAAKRDGTGDPGYSFGDENMVPFSEPGFLAMANSGPETNGSQFFVLTGPVDHLNRAGACPGQGCHSVFGTVVKGLDVVEKIADVARGQNDKPKKDVVLESVTIAEK